MKVNFAFHLEIKVPESGGRVERHRIHVAWSPVWSFHSQWWFGLPCHLLVLVHCVFWSPQSTQPGNFRALHASFCWQALWRCWFHFPAGLGTCPHCQRYQKLVQWPWYYCAWLASKLTWPEPHRESMGYCQEEDERHQTQQCRWPEGRYQRNLGFHTTSAVPQTDHLHTTLNYIIIIIYAFSRRFYPKRLTVHSGYTCFISMCVPWELNPQPFALLMQCSTTEPQEHYNWGSN